MSTVITVLTYHEWIDRLEDISQAVILHSVDQCSLNWVTRIEAVIGCVLVNQERLNSSTVTNQNKPVD